MLLLTLLGLGFGLRQIVQPLQALAQRATALGWGDFQAIEAPVGGIAEIQRLQAELVHMADKIQAAQKSLRDYLGAVTVGQEEERRRLARELHDDTIQSLIALNQRLHLAQMSVADENGAAQLADMQQMVAALIADLRRTIHALRPSYLEDLGLVPALQMLAQESGMAPETTVTFETKGRERRLAPEVEMALYRIAQEALNNVARHAQAAHVQVRQVFDAAQVTMSIADDGRGFRAPQSPSEMAPQGHYGLLSIQERAELIGAALHIESQPGAGTRLTVIAAKRDWRLMDRPQQGDASALVEYDFCPLAGGSHRLLRSFGQFSPFYLPLPGRLVIVLECGLLNQKVAQLGSG